MLTKTYGASSSCNWDNVSSDYKYCNFLESGELLSNINLPIDANQCKNIKCNNITHFKGNDIFYNKLLSHSYLLHILLYQLIILLVLEKLPSVVAVPYQSGIALSKMLMHCQK